MWLERVDVREQQGVSEGHVLPPPQVACEKTEGATAASSSIDCRRRLAMLTIENVYAVENERRVSLCEKVDRWEYSRRKSGRESQAGGTRDDSS